MMAHNCMRLSLIGLFFALVLPAVSGGEVQRWAKGISVSKRFFNPSSGETIAISLTVPASGHLKVTILDRDGFPTRALADKDIAKALSRSFGMAKTIVAPSYLMRPGR
jgi:hypothetical protein